MGYSQDRGPFAQGRSLYSQGLSRFAQDQGLDWILFGLLARSRLGFARSGAICARSVALFARSLSIRARSSFDWILFGLLAKSRLGFARSGSVRGRSVALFARSLSIRARSRATLFARFATPFAQDQELDWILFGLLARSRLGFARSGPFAQGRSLIRKVSLHSRKIKSLIGYFLGYSQGQGWVSQDRGPFAQGRSLYSQGLSRFAQGQGLDWILFRVFAAGPLRWGHLRGGAIRKVLTPLHSLVRTKKLSPRGKRFHIFVLAYFDPAVFNSCYYCLGTVIYVHFLKNA